MEKVGLFISKFVSHLILYEVQFSLGVWNICTDFKEIIRLVPTEETAHTQYFWLNVAWKILRAITVDLQYSSLLFWQDPLYDMKWGHFDRVNLTFKMLLASWNFDTVFKRFRSFNAKNLRSVGQRAAKLLAVKVGGLKKGLPAGPGRSQPVFPGSNPCAFKSFSKFDGW